MGSQSRRGRRCWSWACLTTATTTCSTFENLQDTSTSQTTMMMLMMIMMALEAEAPDSMVCKPSSAHCLDMRYAKVAHCLIQHGHIWGAGPKVFLPAPYLEPPPEDSKLFDARGLPLQEAASDQVGLPVQEWPLMLQYTHAC